MAQLLNLLEELRSEAEFDSHGRFSLDKQKAREKMKKYQLIDPHYYILELVQAAVASGTDKIDVYLDADDCIVTFGGENYTRDDLENIYSSLFVSQKDMSLERFRELAIGLNSATALNPQYIKVDSGDGKEAVTLMITPPDTEELLESPIALDGTKIHVRDRVSLRVLSKFVSKYIAGNLPTEGKILSDRCTYCPVPIRVNDILINPREEMKLDKGREVLCSVEFEEDGVSGILGIPFVPYELSHLQFVKWGVTITTRHLRFTFIPVVGVVRANNLIKNASQSDIVENKIFADVLEKVKRSVDKLLIELVNRYQEFTENKDINKKIRAKEMLFDVIEARFKARDLNENSPELLKKLAEAEIFETTEKKLVNLDLLVRQFKEIGYLPFARKYFSQPHPDNLVVAYLGDEIQVNFFNKVFSNRTKNVEQDFYSIYLREKNLKEWEQRRSKSLILMADPIVSKTVEKDGITIKMGLVNRTANGNSKVAFYIENGKITEKILNIHSLFFDAAVNNNQLKPVYAWNDLEIDNEFRRTIKTILLHLPALYANLAGEYTAGESNPRNEAVRMHLLSYVRFVLGDVKPPKNEKNETPGKDRKPEQTSHVCLIPDVLPGGIKRTGKQTRLEFGDINVALPEYFKELKIFQDIQGNNISLKDLNNDLDKYFKIPYVTRRMPGEQMFEGHIVSCLQGEEEILKNYFGWFKLENYEKSLINERAALKNLQKPEEKPVIMESTIEKINIDIKGINGEIGILKHSDHVKYGTGYSSGKMIKQGIVSLRILKHNRFITNRTIAVPLTGVRAVINDNNINVNTSWTNIIEDKRWENLKDHLTKGLKQLAEKVASRYSSYQFDDVPRIRRFMIEYAGIYMGHLDYVPPEKMKEPVFSKIYDLPLFRQMGEGYYSIGQLKEDLKKFGKVAVVQKPVVGLDPGQRKVCLCNNRELAVLGQLFGKNNVEDVYDYLKEKKIAQIIKKNKPVEEPVINENSVLCKVSIDQDGIRGEMGPVRSFFAPRQAFSSIRFLKENRYVNTRLVNLDLQVEATINCNQLKTDKKWTSIIEDEIYEKIIKILQDNVCPVVETLLQKYSAMDDKDREETEKHIIQYATGKFSCYTEILKRPPNKTLKKIATMKLFTAVGGRRFSFREIAEFYKKNERLYYVYNLTNQKPLNADKIILVLNRGTLKLLKRLFYHLHDYTNELAQEQIAIKNMQKPRLKELSVREGFLASVKVNSGGIEGELALPSQLPSKRMIVFAKNMIPVVEKLLYSRSVVFGYLNCNDFETNKTFDDVKLFATQRKAILGAIYQLYKKLINMYPEMEKAGKGEVGRQLLLDFYYEQKNYVGSEYLIMDREMEEQLSSLPLIPITNGRFVSIDVVVSEIERLGYIPFVYTGEVIDFPSEDVVLQFEKYSAYFDFCRNSFGLDSLRHLEEVLRQKDALEKIDAMKKTRKQKQKQFRRKLEKKKTGTKAGKTKEEIKKGKIEEKTPQRGPGKTRKEQRKESGKDELAVSRIVRPELTPEEELLYSIKKEFRIIRERGDYKISERILRNMKVKPEKSRPAVLFDRENHQVTINTEDPLVRKIMDLTRQNSRSIYYLLSLVYSTINRELLEITDEDEMKFQMIMLENLLEYPEYKVTNKVTAGISGKGGNPDE